MLSIDEDALICDLMEVYRISDWRAYPVMFIATLAWGLKDDSRIKLALAGSKVPTEIQLSAAILDRLTLLCWMQTEDGHKGRNKPKSVLDQLLGKKPQDHMTFDSIEEFKAARAKIINGGG